MWPWSSQDVTTELPESLQDFYSKSDPQHKATLSDSQRSGHVQQVLAQRAQAYDHQLEKHKSQENVRVSAAINCAELQQAVVECYRGWSFLRGNECSAEISRTTKCMDVQQAALKSLRYESCYSQSHCRQIKAAVDAIFTENFGRLGEKLGDPACHSQFDHDVDSVFSIVWR